MRLGRWLCSPQPWLILAVTVVLLTGTLHIQSALFQYRVHRVLRGMEQLRLEQTTSEQMLRLVPALRPIPSELLPFGRGCRLWECYAVDIHNNLDVLAGLARHRYLHEAAYWAGGRAARLIAVVSVERGRVRNVHYSLTVESTTHPGYLEVEVHSVYWLRSSTYVQDQSPEYVVTERQQWPDSLVWVAFTPYARAHQMSHAFHADLNCMWSLRGCRAARQMLPEAWRDRQATEKAAVARLRGPEPCPSTLLRVRVRDTSGILLVEVENVQRIPGNDGVPVVMVAHYKLLRILRQEGEVAASSHSLSKGDLMRLLEHNFSVQFPLSKANESITNPDIRLLQPGARLIAFYPQPFVCSIFPASQQNIGILEKALASNSSRFSPADRSGPL